MKTIVNSFFSVLVAIIIVVICANSAQAWTSVDDYLIKQKAMQYIYDDSNPVEDTTFRKIDIVARSQKEISDGVIDFYTFDIEVDVKGQGKFVYALRLYFENKFKESHITGGVERYCALTSDSITMAEYRKKLTKYTQATINMEVH